MEALLLAAGLGTRLHPLTDHRPKALVEADGRTLLEINLQRLMQLRVQHVVINVHHFADMVVDYLRQRTWTCPTTISDERDLLLDTGGAIAHAAPHFDGRSPILIHNVDVLEKIDINAMLQQHQRQGNIATLAVSQRDTSRYLLTDSSGLLCGWHNTKSHETLHVANQQHDTTAAHSLSPLAFSGIAIIDPQMLTLLPTGDHPYPIIPEYLRLAAKYRIATYQHSAADWMDVGCHETLKQATDFIHLHQL